MKHVRRMELGGAVIVSLFAFAAHSASAPTTLTITSVVFDKEKTSISIHGSNMCDAPSVAVDGIPQTVTMATAALVTIVRPDYAPGSYSLIVSCGPEPGRTGRFAVVFRRERPRGR